ncbi:CLUMA_CG011856, isoform A [Clunio marinus]|uniref:CLUMA_CG011856, isoform A n=1 Tax=Clunio marinus TaxID=568069 RepID=A0A1J1IE65_9DIPT|nr:CLUMA_CG011856, isoform A [Clunio marinus]
MILQLVCPIHCRSFDGDCAYDDLRQKIHLPEEFHAESKNRSNIIYNVFTMLELNIHTEDSKV